MTELLTNPLFEGVGGQGSTDIPGWSLTRGSTYGNTAGDGTISINSQRAVLTGPEPGAPAIPGGVYTATFHRCYSQYTAVIISIMLGETVLHSSELESVNPITITGTVPVDYAGSDVVTLHIEGIKTSNDEIVVVNPSLTVVVPDTEPEPDPDPDPEPEPEPDGIGAQILRFIGTVGDVEQAEQHGQIITQMVRAYTRGGGFTPDPNPELEAVIITSTARLLANPEQIATGVGSVQIHGGFKGFNLAELAVLNRYRKRAA